MTRAAIECAACGNTSHVPISSVLLDAGGPYGDLGHAGDMRDMGDPGSVAGTVSWICRPCGDVITQPVSWPVLQALLDAGAPLFDEGDPRPEHPETSAGGPALTRDDVLDLHTALENPLWFDELLASASQA